MSKNELPPKDDPCIHFIHRDHPLLRKFAEEHLPLYFPSETPEGKSESGEKSKDSEDLNLGRFGMLAPIYRDIFSKFEFEEGGGRFPAVKGLKKGKIKSRLATLRNDLKRFAEFFKK